MKWIAILITSGGLGSIGYLFSKNIIEWLRFQSLGTRDYVVDKLSLMFIDSTPEKVMRWMLMATGGAFLLPQLLMFPNFKASVPMGIIYAILIWKSPKIIVDTMHKRRTQKFVSQMVDALALLSNGLKSGLSVSQSIGLVAQEMPEPTRQEFNLLLNENKLGVSLEEAFENLGRRLKTDDVEMFVTAVNILKETGGNLAETFDTISFTIRERIKAETKISALTASGFYQGIGVMSVPPVLGLILYQSDPGLMGPVFTHPVGWAMLGLILILEALGFFLILRIVRVDV